MINIEELRIGSFVVDTTSTSNKVIVKILSVSYEGYLIVKNSSKTPTKVLIESIEPLIITKDLLSQISDHGVLIKNPRKKNYYFFPNKSETYFLVYDKNEDNYFMGMIDLSLPEKHRRLTRPFYEYHKLQNAFKTVYDLELKELNI